jgi:MOSC domain-containing protein YiiM
MAAVITAVHARAVHSFSKDACAQIELVAGHGVRGDAHYGTNVKHRSRVAKNPQQPNLRQVHLLHEELFTELRQAGFEIAPGQMGENVTTRGLDILGLSTGTRLRLGENAIVQLTGLRNPCYQIEGFRKGLLAAVLDRAADGALVRKAGVMCVVIEGGIVRPEDPITVVQAPLQRAPLQTV